MSASLAQITVLQSQCIHPDWKPDMHLAYLEEECIADGVTEAQVTEWLEDNLRIGAVEAVLADAEMRDADDPPEYEDDVFADAAGEWADVDFLPGGKDAGADR